MNRDYEPVVYLECIPCFSLLFGKINNKHLSGCNAKNQTHFVYSGSFPYFASFIFLIQISSNENMSIYDISNI